MDTAGDVGTETPDIAPGDIITIGGVYKKRTFWEFVTGKPKTLEQFVIRGKITV